MENEKIIAEIEAILFIYGEPISLNKISDLLQIEPDKTKEALESLKTRLLENQSGLSLVSLENNYQLVTRPDLSDVLGKIIKSEVSESLSPASIETLSLIAYLGPISRPELDYIRGVNSSFILRNLLIRGIIERSVDDKKTNSYLYKPSIDLVKYLGVQKIEDLPEYESFRKVLEDFRKQPEEQIESPKQIS